MMSGRRKATLATLAGSVSNTLVVALQAVVLIPLYMRYVGPRLYGAWLGSGDVLVWMQALDLGLPNLMIQRISAAHGKQDSRTVAEWLATGGLVLFLLSALIIAIGAGLSPFIPRWMGVSGEEARQLRACFAVGACAAGLTMFNNTFVGLSRGVQDTALMNVSLLCSAAVGFATSLALLMTGWGLWAIPLGMVARVCVLLVGSGVFVTRKLRSGLGRYLAVRRQLFREFFRVAPATGVAGVSYALMNQSETALVAILLSPEIAAVLNITRKAVDVARAVLDTVGFATYGSFAHLAGSDQRSRALDVHADIREVRFSLAFAAAAVYLAVNRDLVAVWVGPAQFGGELLTCGMAVQLVFVGQSYLWNYLYRATGPVVRGSVGLIVECLARVPLMITLIVTLGLVGVPIAAIVTSATAIIVLHRWTAQEFADVGAGAERAPRAVGPWVARAAIVALAIAMATRSAVPSWGRVLTTAVGIGGVALLAQLALVPRLRRAGQDALSVIGSRFVRTGTSQ
jgi:O-antigen/teichoic acid export membrane protein